MSSRATAVTTVGRAFPRAASRRTRRHSRCCAVQSEPRTRYPRLRSLIRDFPGTSGICRLARAQRLTGDPATNCGSLIHAISFNVRFPGDFGPSTWGMSGACPPRWTDRPRHRAAAVSSASVRAPWLSGAPTSRWGASRGQGPSIPAVPRIDRWSERSRPWVQQPAGTCPNSWRDGFARDCPLRHYF